ncbi:MAG: TRAP transporter substrate-binding protein [Spirochaetaceae bacterium]|nr:MAG: TRAP transporter substrate-binding protein [Spirochaetaceae bacterium]
MKRRIGIALIFALLLPALAFTAGARESATGGAINLVVAHNQTSTDNPYQFGMVEFKNVLERLSGGSMTVTVHAGTLGTNESELIEQLQLGAVDLVVASPGFMTRIGVPEVNILALLYLFDDFEHWERAVDGDFGREMRDIIAQRTNNDFMIMGYWSAGVRHFYGSRPIVEPTDARGLRIRLQDSPVQQAFWSQVGAIPAQVGWGELYQALQQGTVDAAENDFTNFSLQDHHRTRNGRFISETYHDFTTRLLLANGNRLNRFTPQQQQWIQEAAEAATAKEREVTYRMLDESRSRVIAEGGTVNQVNLPAFRQIALPIQDQFARDNNMTQLLEAVRATR